MRDAAGVLAAAAFAFSAAALAQENPCARQDTALRAQSDRYTVYFRMLPSPAVGRHFGLAFAVCRPAGAAHPDSVAVDARMPSHGHGMNYRPTVAALGEGRYRAEGLMLHMPGVWELAFVVREAGTSERITYSLTLK